MGQKPPHEKTLGPATYQRQKPNEHVGLADKVLHVELAADLAGAVCLRARIHLRAADAPHQCVRETNSATAGAAVVNCASVTGLPYCCYPSPRDTRARVISPRAEIRGRALIFPRLRPAPVTVRRRRAYGLPPGRRRAVKSQSAGDRGWGGGRRCPFIVRGHPDVLASYQLTGYRVLCAQKQISVSVVR